MNSHIQMPKLLLKRFEKNHRFFYYIVEKGCIGNNGHADSANTQEDYYSAEMEQYLEKNIETPFSRLLQVIDRIDMYNTAFTPSIEEIACAKNFIKALIARSPTFPSEIDKKTVFYQFISIPRQKRNDYATQFGIEYLNHNDFFRDYSITFAVNNSSLPFVLPICGLYSFKMHGYNHHLLPLSPSIGIILADKRVMNVFPQCNRLPYYLFRYDSQIQFFNQTAFRTQCELGYGIVVSHDRSVLEKLMTDYGLNATHE